jgi:DnaJ family protein C protein 27
MAADLSLPNRRLADVRAVLAQVPKPQIARLKVLSMGSSEAGKSCLIKRYCEERFIPKYIQTIGIDYGVKRVAVDGRDVRVNFWDLAGSGEYFEIRNEFYKDAQAALLVYDVTNPRTFAQLEQWLSEAQRYGAKDLVVMVCANKIDLAAKRAVSEADGRKWAAAKGYAYWETSASTGQNVNAMFEQMFRDAALLRM